MLSVEAQIFQLTRRVEQLEREVARLRSDGYGSAKVRGWSKAAQLRGVSAVTLRRMVQRGEVPKPKIVRSFICGKTASGEKRACVIPEWNTADLLD